MTVTTFNVLAPCYKRVQQPDGTTAMEASDRATASDGSVPKIWYRAQSGSDADARDMASIAAPRVRGGGAPLGAAPGRVPLEGNLGNR